MSARPLLALVALLLSLAATPALAQAEGLTLREESAEGKELEPGAELLLLSENLTLETETLTVSCAETEGTGTLTENGGDLAEGELTGMTFEGGGKCSTSSFFKAAVSVSNLPWTVEALEGGEAIVSGAPAVLSIDLYSGETLVAECNYETSSFTGAFEFNEPLGLLFSAQEATGSGVGCPEVGLLSAEFTVTTGGKPVVPTPAVKVTLRETNAAGKALAVNSTVSGTSSNIIFTKNGTSEKIECSTNSFAGKVTRNGEVEAQVDTTSIAFEGGGAGTKCKSSIKVNGEATEAVLTPEKTWQLRFSAFETARFFNFALKVQLYNGKGTLVLTCQHGGLWSNAYTIDSALGLSTNPGHLQVVTGSDKDCVKLLTSNSFTVTTSPGGQAVVPTVAK